MGWNGLPAGWDEEGVAGDRRVVWGLKSSEKALLTMGGGDLENLVGGLRC